MSNKINKDLPIIKMIFTPDDIKELIKMLECYSRSIGPAWTNDGSVEAWRNKVEFNIGKFKKALKERQQQEG